MGNELVTQTVETSIDFYNPKVMEGIMQVASMMSKSQLIPRAYRDKPADCMIAMVRSRKLGMDIFSFMESTYPVNGKLGFEGKLIIALINQSGIFSGPLRWKYSGDKKETRKVVCFGTLKTVDPNDPTNGKVEMEMTYQQAVAHKWTLPRSKMENGIKVGEQPSPWEVDTDQMLAYRSAAYLGRLYCPSVTMGMYERDELEVQDAIIVEETEAPKTSLFGKTSVQQPAEAPPIQVVVTAATTTTASITDAVVVEPTKPEVQSQSVGLAVPSEPPKATPQAPQSAPQPVQPPPTVHQPQAPAASQEDPQTTEEDNKKFIETIRRKLGPVLEFAEKYWVEGKFIQEGQNINSLPSKTSKAICANFSGFQKKLSVWMDKKAAEREAAQKAKDAAK